MLAILQAPTVHSVTRGSNYPIFKDSGPKYDHFRVPGEPAAHNYGLLEANNGLLWGQWPIISSYLAVQVWFLEPESVNIGYLDPLGSFARLEARTIAAKEAPRSSPK